MTEQESTTQGHLPSDPDRRRRNLRLLLLVGVPALILSAALGMWLHGGRYVWTENAFVRADITQIASEVQGRIADIVAREHATVSPGQLLMRNRSGALRTRVSKS